MILTIIPSIFCSNRLYHANLHKFDLQILPPVHTRLQPGPKLPPGPVLLQNLRVPCNVVTEPALNSPSGTSPSEGYGRRSWIVQQLHASAKDLSESMIKLHEWPTSLFDKINTFKRRRLCTLHSEQQCQRCLVKDHESIIVIRQSFIPTIHIRCPLCSPQKNIHPQLIKANSYQMVMRECIFSNPYSIFCCKW